MLNESEFLSAYGIRSLSRYHQNHPYFLRLDQNEYTIDYQPAESRTRRSGQAESWAGFRVCSLSAAGFSARVRTFAQMRIREGRSGL
jgi:hypothetical protein